MKAGGQSLKRRFDGYVLPLVGPAMLELDCAASDPARTDDKLIGYADQIHCREFGARRFVAIVIERVEAGM